MIPRDLAFDDEEYRRRLAVVQRAMALEGLDALVLTRLGDVNYLTGMDAENYTDPQVVIIEPEGDPTLVVWRFEEGRVANSVWCSNVAFYQERTDLPSAVLGAIRERRLESGRIGLEADVASLTPREFNAIASDVPNATIAGTAGILNNARIRKSDAELAYMRQAGTISMDALAAGGEAIHAGVTDNEIAAAIMTTLYRQGSGIVPWGPAVAVGYRAGAPHCTFDGRRAEPGDTVFLELTAQRRRYVAPVMTTWVVGERSPALDYLARIGSDIIATIVDSARPDVSAADVAVLVDRIVAKVIDRYGLFMPPHYGYPVGLGFAPTWDEGLGFVINRDNHRQLEAGMVFHLPISLRRYGEFGVNHSATIVIGSGSAETVTRPLGMLPAARQ